MSSQDKSRSPPFLKVGVCHSAVTCFKCGGFFRTKQGYVDDLEDAMQYETGERI
jgi:hypothetical protein